MSLSNRLISWYQIHKRDLPWRHTRDPYAIWLSEVILQQTRVNQGMAYYYRFLESFPTVFDLAAAGEDKVMKAWQGLGYYSRARNLHATAKHVANNLGGIFPDTSQGLKTLKGIGDYTAAAIASFSYDECIPVLDGNVQRVVARLMAMYEPIDKPATKAHMLQILREWIDPNSPALFNQAMMELGALQCTPQSPDCTLCPLQASCMSFEKGCQHELPVKAGKTKVSDLWLYYFVVLRGEEILIRHRMHSGIWKGLYDFPSIEKPESTPIPEVLNQWKQERSLKGKLLLDGSPVELHHVLSHRRVHASFIALAAEEHIVCDESEQWISSKDILRFGVSRLVDRYIREHSQLLGGME